MVRTHTLIALVVSVSVCGFLACKSSHEHGAQAHEGHEAKEAAESKEDEANEEHEGLELAQPAVSLSAAIATAQKSVPDGRFLKAEIESEDGKVICSIVLASGSGQREVNVDATNGKILGTEEEKLEPECSEILEALAKDPAHAPVGAGKAIETALAETPGAWALYAGLNQEEGQLVYTVFLIDGKTPKLAVLGAADGKLQKISVVEEDEENEGMEESEGKEGKEAPPPKPK
jgi:uncharacterized membrane protein YkoI